MDTQQNNYPKPQTEAVYRSDLPRKDYVDRTKSKRHEILYEDEYGMSAHIEFEVVGQAAPGEIVDIDEEAKEYTVNDVDYDVEKIHFRCYWLHKFGLSQRKLRRFN